MASTAALASRAPASTNNGEVTLLRLYILRATYLLLVVGIGGMVLPPLIFHEPLARGVIPSLIGGVGLLAVLGLRYPLKMLPVLFFEFVWKTIWLLDFGLPQWSTGPRPPTFAEDFFAIGVGTVLMPLVIPWGYVWRNFVKAPGDRWR